MVLKLVGSLGLCAYGARLRGDQWQDIDQLRYEHSGESHDYHRIPFWMQYLNGGLPPTWWAYRYDPRFHAQVLCHAQSYDQWHRSYTSIQYCQSERWFPGHLNQRLLRPIEWVDLSHFGPTTLVVYGMISYKYLSLHISSLEISVLLHQYFSTSSQY